jgi:membrane dipeptidase
MQFIDMHCDSVMLALAKDKEKHSLYDSKYTMVDFKKMKQGEAMVQCFAVFLPLEQAFDMMGLEKMDDESYIALARKCIMDNVSAHENIIKMAYNADDIKENWDSGKMSAVLTMEDGRAVLGKLENIKRFYDMGFRACSLTWNFKNCFGSPNSKGPDAMAEGLTKFGKEGVKYMQELGMLVDVSHLSEGGFWDVANICKKPFVATHSNAKALSPHQRNLTDDQIKALAISGGVTGLNFAPAFLNEDVSCNDSTARLLAKHARHIVNVGGINVCGIGSDLDGISGNIEIGSSDKMQMLVSALKKENFSDDEIEKIFYKNVLRVFKDAVK